MKQAIFREELIPKTSAEALKRPEMAKFVFVDDDVIDRSLEPVIRRSVESSLASEGRVEDAAGIPSSGIEVWRS